MNAFDTLTGLARGERPLTDSLIGTCRLEGLGGEAYAEEAIVESFRNAPIAFDAADDRIATPMHAALFHTAPNGDTTALIADLYDGHVGRIWRLGPGQPIAAERAVSVPFDPDLHQQRGDVQFSADEHPDLHPDAAAHVVATAKALARDWSESEGAPAHRTRCFVVRAFSDGDRGVALLAVYRFGGGTRRSIDFTHSAIRFRFSGETLLDSQIVHDVASSSVVSADNWAPRI